MAGQQLDRYTPGGALQHAGERVDVIAQHAAADAQIARLMGMPIRQYRREEDVLARIRDLALRAGDDFFYSFPVKNKASGKSSEISGPSIGLAEQLLFAARNCGVVSTHIETEDAWVFTATFVDAEAQVSMSRERRQRRGQQTIRTEDEGRAQDIAFAIGQSKAIRDVVTRALRPYADYAVAMAKKEMAKAISQSAKHMSAAREKILLRLREAGVPIERVARWVGKGAGEWDADDMVKVGAALNGIAEGLTTPGELWPDPRLDGPAPEAPPARKGQQAKREEPPPAEPDPGREPEPETPIA